MNVFYDKVANIIGVLSPNFEIVEKDNDLTYIVNSASILEVANELKNNVDTKFNQLIDITAVDLYDKADFRFEVVYFLYSIENKKRIRLKIRIEDAEKPKVNSITSIYKSADWYERETYDMYGIIFENHPDLRRFYMPEDFNDPTTGEPLYPLRKDFPLMGIEGSLPLPPFPEKELM